MDIPSGDYIISSCVLQDQQSSTIIIIIVHPLHGVVLLCTAIYLHNRIGEQYIDIRESVDSLCRDDTYIPIT